MKCLETRRIGCLTMRRLIKDNGRRVKTMELPWSLWLRVRSTVMRDIAAFERTEAARDRVALVINLLAEGNKTEYIADVVGLTGQRIRQIKCREAKKTTPKALRKSQSATTIATPTKDNDAHTTQWP